MNRSRLGRPRAWVAQMRRSLRPNQYLRMIENRFVTSEQAFVPMAAWDRCVDPQLAPPSPDRGIPVYVGVDASVKHDSSAIVAMHLGRQAPSRFGWSFIAIFQPSPEEPLDFEGTIEATLLDLHQRFNIVKVLFDPYQMVATAQRLTQAGLPIEEFPQSPANLTAASQNLFELINAGNLVAYPNEAMRLRCRGRSRSRPHEAGASPKRNKPQDRCRGRIRHVCSCCCSWSWRRQCLSSRLQLGFRSDDDEEIVDIKMPPKRLHAYLTPEQYERITRPVALFPLGRQA